MQEMIIEFFQYKKKNYPEEGSNNGIKLGTFVSGRW